MKTNAAIPQSLEHTNNTTSKQNNYVAATIYAPTISTAKKTHHSNRTTTTQQQMCNTPNSALTYTTLVQHRPMNIRIDWHTVSEHRVCGLPCKISKNLGRPRQGKPTHHQPTTQEGVRRNPLHLEKMCIHTVERGNGI